MEAFIQHEETAGQSRIT